jgi:membrane protease YdiL (CAAX protease family)
MRDAHSLDDRLPPFYARRGKLGRTLIEAVVLVVLVSWLALQLKAHRLEALLPSQTNTSAVMALFNQGGESGAPLPSASSGSLEQPTSPLGTTPHTEPASPETLPRGSSAQNTGLPWTSLIVMLLVAVLIGPLIEEALFRGVPLLITNALKRSGRFDPQEPIRIGQRVLPAHWLIGVLAALLFSVSHGLGDAYPHFPLPQFIAGLWFWWVAYSRGLRYSILMHGTYNLIPVGFFVLGLP